MFCILATKKVEAVLEIARKDSAHFLPDLVRDPAKTLAQSGIDLTVAETLAVIDVVQGSHLSPYEKNLGNARAIWREIIGDSLPDLNGRVDLPEIAVEPR